MSTEAIPKQTRVKMRKTKLNIERTTSSRAAFFARTGSYLILPNYRIALSASYPANTYLQNKRWNTFELERVAELDCILGMETNSKVSRDDKFPT